jgi:hypothetical protein
MPSLDGREMPAKRLGDYYLNGQPDYIITGARPQQHAPQLD